MIQAQSTSITTSEINRRIGLRRLQLVDRVESELSNEEDNQTQTSEPINWIADHRHMRVEDVLPTASQCPTHILKTDSSAAWTIIICLGISIDLGKSSAKVHMHLSVSQRTWRQERSLRSKSMTKRSCRTRWKRGQCRGRSSPCQRLTTRTSSKCVTWSRPINRSA